MKRLNLFKIVIYLLPLLLLVELNAQTTCNQVQSFPSDFMSSKITLDGCSQNKGEFSGERIWEDGTTYRGAFKNGELHGIGKINFNKGISFYEGSFEDGVPHGYGKIIYEDGSKYEGDWENGKKEGSGSYIFSCGGEYLGEFKQDQINGEGVALSKDGVSYAGLWKAGLANGEGTVNNPDGSQFKGSFKLAERHGAGVVSYVSKDTLIGNWLQGRLEGKSTTKFVTGSKVINYWKDGVLEKKVVYQAPNGFPLSGSANQVASIFQNSSFGKSDEEHANLSMAWYIIALEYKSINEFEQAEKSLQFAQQFDSPIFDSPVDQLIKSEFANIGTKKEKVRMAKVQSDFSSQ
jgi:hypothetical protein